MPKRARETRQHETGKWFAPPSGGYSGLGPDGQVVTRKGMPPKIPATAAGVQRLQQGGPHSAAPSSDSTSGGS